MEIVSQEKVWARDRPSLARRGRTVAEAKAAFYAQF